MCRSLLVMAWSLFAFLRRDRRIQCRVLSRRMTWSDFCFKRIGPAAEWRVDRVWGGASRCRDMG